jgi:hypothetical protein
MPPVVSRRFSPINEVSSGEHMGVAAAGSNGDVTTGASL